MKITKINASFSCKKQIRQYEPIDVFMSVEAELDYGNETNIEELQEHIFRIAKDGVDVQIAKLMGTPPPSKQQALSVNLNTDDLPF